MTCYICYPGFWLALIIGAHAGEGNGCTLPQNLMFSFVDASAKLPSAILSGNVVDMGAFDQCLALDVTLDNTRYRGKYCLIKVLMPGRTGMKEEPHGDDRVATVLEDQTGPGLVLGWCVPDSCPAANITQSAMDVIQGFATFLPESLRNITIIPFQGGRCQTQETIDEEASTFSGADIGAIAFLFTILATMVASTMYDIVLRYTNEEPAHLLLIAFSVRTNGEKLLAISNNPNQLPCLHGIRFISMLWIIYSHRFLTTSAEAIINIADFTPWMNRLENMHVLGATISVDTFFLLSGLLVAYAFLQAKDKGVKFNVPMYWLHRYIRLTPALGVMILFQATLLNRFGSGPFWYKLDTLKITCQEKWWSNLLYIHNYYKSETICLGQSWYLAVDTQLFFLSPLILIPLWRWPKRTLYASLALVIGSIVSSFVVSYHFDLSIGGIGSNAAYMVQYYYATHTRFGPWLMGVMLGYYVFKLKKNNAKDFSLHPSQVAAGWLVSLILMLTVLFAPHNALFVHDRLANAFLNGLHRHVWTLGLCWVVYACTEGYGGPINAFLSWSPFQVLGRLTYSMYLIHLNVQYLIGAEQRTSDYFTAFNVMYKFWGDVFVTVALSICLSLSFESPVLVIEKVIFKTGTASKRRELKAPQP